MKKIYFFTSILLLLLVSIKSFSFTIIEKLSLPSNAVYFKKLNITLNRIPREMFGEKKILNKNVAGLIKNSENLPQINLTGIVKMDGKYYAILNGNSYIEGNKIKNFVIKKITLNKVILESSKNQNQRFTLEIENN